VHFSGAAIVCIVCVQQLPFNRRTPSDARAYAQRSGERASANADLP
jgi:hypothetical protein